MRLSSKEKPFPQNNTVENISKQNRRAALKRKVRAAAVVSGIAVSIPTVVNMVGDNEPNPVVALDNATNHFQYELGTNFCPKGMKPERAQEILRLIEQPGNVDPAVAKKTAEARGLHFADPSKSLEQLNKVTTREEVTEIVNDYTKKEFNIAFKLDPSYKTMSETPPEAFRNDAKEFVFYTSVIPSELIQNLHADQIIIKANDVNSGTYNYHKKTIKLVPSVFGSPSTFVHEALGHGIASTSCEGFDARDPAFTKYNPDDFRYVGEDWVDRQTPGDYWTSDIVADPYALHSPMEDFAVSVQTFITGGIFYDFHQNTPATEKLAVALDRIDSVAPGSVEYLSSIRDSFSRYISYTVFAPPPEDVNDAHVYYAGIAEDFYKKGLEPTEAEVATDHMPHQYYDKDD